MALVLATIAPRIFSNCDMGASATTAPGAGLTRTALARRPRVGRLAFGRSAVAAPGVARGSGLWRAVKDPQGCRSAAARTSPSIYRKSSHSSETRSPRNCAFIPARLRTRVQPPRHHPPDPSRGRGPRRPALLVRCFAPFRGVLSVDVEPMFRGRPTLFLTAAMSAYGAVARAVWFPQVPGLPIAESGGLGRPRPAHLRLLPLLPTARRRRP
jgi:hypothetical protein